MIDYVIAGLRGATIAVVLGFGFAGVILGVMWLAAWVQDHFDSATAMTIMFFVFLALVGAMVGTGMYHSGR